MDPATAALLATARFFEFLCTPAGQKFAEQAFKDGQELRTKFEEWKAAHRIIA
jgi:hypothetical protein